MRRTPMNFIVRRSALIIGLCMFAGAVAGILSTTVSAGPTNAVGKVRFLVTFTCPGDLEAEGDRIFKSHIAWMQPTHPHEGPKALLSYDVSKTPELSDPFVLDSKPTGNVIFVLTEVYETDAGVVNHFDLSKATWKDFQAWGDFAAKCKTTKVGAAKIFNSLW
jgi:hypothetical protein